VIATQEHKKWYVVGIGVQENPMISFWLFRPHPKIRELSEVKFGPFDMPHAGGFRQNCSKTPPASLALFFLDFHSPVI
jgi:hypothetical protein